jgi:hypothetical protein
MSTPVSNIEKPLMKPELPEFEVGDQVAVAVLIREPPAKGAKDKGEKTRVQNFMHWLDARSVVPVIRDLHAQAETLRQGELERAQRMLARGDDPALVLEALGVDQFAIYLMHDQKDETLNAYGQRIIPELR